LLRYNMVDCHMHSSFSADSHTDMAEHCKAAIELGLTGICFTEHVDFDPVDFCYGFFNYDAYRRGIEAARARFGDRLAIGMGAEISFSSDAADDISRFLDSHEFDFVIGSVHLVDHVFVGRAPFFDGRSEEQVYAPYWAEMEAMAASGLFRHIGHFDYPKQARPSQWGPLSIERWREPIGAALRAVLDAGALLEVNTSGIRKGTGEPFPSWDILNLYSQLGGTAVTMGSDAHRSCDVGAFFDPVRDRLNAMGLAVVGIDLPA
jgi:histidinol-phosphatase (PHP family)